MDKKPSDPEPAKEAVPITYYVCIRKPGGQAKERFHTRDRASAVSFYQGLLPTGGWQKLLVLDDGEARRIVETTRYEDDKPFASPGEAFDGFDWTPPQRKPSLEQARAEGAAVELRGDPTKPHDAERRKDILAAHKLGIEPPKKSK